MDTMMKTLDIDLELSAIAIQDDFRQSVLNHIKSEPEIETFIPYNQLNQCLDDANCGKPSGPVDSWSDGVKLHCCRECPQAYDLLEELQQHTVVAHGATIDFPCPQCDMQFDSLPHLRRHLTFRHPEKSFRCGKCQQEFPTVHLFSQHVRMHNEERPHKCHECQKTFKRLEHLKIHAMTHTGEKPYHCMLCTRSFSYRVVLKQHMLTHSSDRPHKCDKCDKSFKRLGDLKAHLDSSLHNNATSKPFRCNVCQRCYSRKTFKSHLALHTGPSKEVYDSHPAGTPDINTCQLAIPVIEPPLSAKSIFDPIWLPYRCQECEQSFHSAPELLTHIVMDHACLVAHECPHCHRRFIYESDLRKHLEASHGRQFKCEICRHSFRQPDRLLKHLLTHLGVKAHHCYHCDRCFFRVGQLKRHLKITKHVGTKPQIPVVELEKLYRFNGRPINMKIVETLNDCIQMGLPDTDVARRDVKKFERTSKPPEGNSELQKSSIVDTVVGDKQFACTQCDEKFACRTELTTHNLTTHTVAAFECKHCHIRFIAHCDLKRHLLRHERPFHCSMCEQRFSTSIALKHHQQARHSTTQKPLECSVCHWRFNRSDGLKYHMTVHHGEKKHKCEHCGECFAMLIELKRHHRTAHSIKKKKTLAPKYLPGGLYQCPECPRILSCALSFKHHMQGFHTMEFPFLCDQCDARFVQKRSLREHLREHTGDTFDCPVCQRKFLRATHLKQHSLIHLGPVPRTHQCAVCGCFFTSATILKNHMYRHETVRQFKCSQCDKEFKRPGDLRQHINDMHLAVKKHRCDKCHKTFSRLSRLTVHARIHNKDAP